ncbi:hypothetical protein CR513_38072, partial [Mucuna pruriens]
MKHPTGDHSLFGIDFIDELVEVSLQLGNNGEDILDFTGQTKKLKAEIMSARLVPSPIQANQSDPTTTNDNSSSSPPPIELKPLPSHLKYAYLDIE